jgi:O-antigen/teichoic acid export membrane protein
MNKLGKDILFSTGFAVLNVVLNFWLIKEAEYLLSALALSIFLVMRRVVPTFTNLSQLGTSQAIVRYASINKGNTDKIKTYFAISFTIWVGSCIVLALLYVGFGAELGSFIYDEVEGTDNFKPYFLITVWYIAIIHLSYLVQPYFLVQRKIFLYNVINMMNASLILLLVISYLKMTTNAGQTINSIIVKIDIENFLTYALIIMSIVQLLLMVHIVIQLKIYNYPSLEKIKAYGKEFIQYGLPRSVMTFSDMFLLTVSAFMITAGNEDITAFLLALTLARIVLIVLQPISKLSSVIVGNNNSPERQKTATNLMTGVIMYSTFLLVIILYNWLDVLIKYWISDPDRIVNVLYAFKILAFGLIPYSIFHGLKGIIEIKFFKPFNLYSILIAIVFHIALFYVFRDSQGNLFALSFSLMIGFVSLGIATLYWCRKDFNNYKYFRLEILLIVGLALFAMNFYINSIYPNIIACIICVLISAGLYAGILFFSKVKFISETINILLKRGN